MPYNTDKDKLVKLFTKEDGKGELLFSLFSYDGATAKLQMHRSFENKAGVVNHGKLGRMTKEEVEWFRDNVDEILSLMTDSTE